ncbi:hypothetical protein Barb7_01387 [Bacteroidales bacterium Barb7]|nr:hypothetical protein Barb7_01387 [Bacteroidales bacterium Barb7]
MEASSISFTLSAVMRASIALDRLHMSDFSSVRSAVISSVNAPSKAYSLPSKYEESAETFW